MLVEKRTARQNERRSNTHLRPAVQQDVDEFAVIPGDGDVQRRAAERCGGVHVGAEAQQVLREAQVAAMRGDEERHVRAPLEELGALSRQHVVERCRLERGAARLAGAHAEAHYPFEIVRRHRLHQLSPHYPRV